ncbi:MAG: sugar phosphate isomerase/epimerase family protein [Anaerolineae bacterium]
MQYGVCADPVFAPAIAAAGFDFIELNVQKHLKPMDEEPAFLDELPHIQASPLPALAANSFFPAALKITGPKVDWQALEHYASTAFRRAEAAGVRTVVFGSGGARRIPDGFDRERAWSQLVRFGKMIGPLAERHGVTVVVEPLNATRDESNVLTTIGESARYMRDVNHPNVRLLIDAYHWGLDNDSFDDLVTNAPFIRHVHIATVESRVPPGFEPCDFSDFFRALKVGGYDGPVSIEAGWTDLEAQLEEAYRALTGLAKEAGL